MSRSEDREQLARLILGEDLVYDGAEATTKGGMSRDAGQRLWRALGFPDPGDDVAYGDADVAAMRLVSDLLEGDGIDEETIFRISRALGRTMARLADWQVSTLVDVVESEVRSGSASTRLTAAVGLAQDVAPTFEKLMIYAWRRHLAAAAARMEALGAADVELLTSTMTVGFADLTRFTSLSNDLDEDALAQLVEEFEDLCTDIVTGHGGRVIKTLGDAVLYVAGDPVQATITALDVVQQLNARPNLPDGCVGLATGSVLSRLGDVFGPPVNLAARLSNVARANRVLVDAVTAAALGPEFDQRVMPPRPVRGFGNVSPVTVSRRRSFFTR